ncbi:hypothetical protein Tco_0692225 [Tanacetum coccineum]
MRLYPMRLVFGMKCWEKYKLENVQYFRIVDSITSVFHCYQLGFIQGKSVTSFTELKVIYTKVTALRIPMIKKGEYGLMVHEDATGNLLSFHDAAVAKTLYGQPLKARFEVMMNQEDAKEIFETTIRDVFYRIREELDSAYRMVCYMIRGQPGLDELEFDDLYNNLKVLEHELNGVFQFKLIKILLFCPHESKGVLLKQRKEIVAIEDSNSDALWPGKMEFDEEQMHFGQDGLGDFGLEQTKLMIYSVSCFDGFNIESNQCGHGYWKKDLVTKGGTARSRVPRAVLSQSTGRPYYPRLDNIRPRTSSFSPSKRAIQETNLKDYDISRQWLLWMYMTRDMDSYEGLLMEFLMGRSPNISFMRPFGCPLTILNTLITLGKESMLIKGGKNKHTEDDTAEKEFIVSEEQVFMIALSSGNTPTDSDDDAQKDEELQKVSQALADESWVEAMQEELLHSQLAVVMGIIVAFLDSDYAGDNQDRRSTSGGCQYLGRPAQTDQELTPSRQEQNQTVQTQTPPDRQNTDTEQQIPDASDRRHKDIPQSRLD